jgi:phage shock protein E
MKGMIRAIVLLMAICLPLAAAEKDNMIDQGQLVTRINSGQAPTLIDVRTPEEFRAGHIPGAINIPLQEFEQSFDELSAYKDREAVLYCESGMRASHGGGWLESQGFDQLRYLDGHMGAWRRAGLPSEQ